MQVARKYQLLFLIFVVLGVFYPAIFAGVNSVDDWRMLYTLEHSTYTDFLERFFPTSGFYYRPLLMLTFYAEYLLWNTEPSFFHLTNIVIHAANVCLVFLLAEAFLAFKEEDPQPGYIPLFCGLLFAVHPIVTESVNWISGRTDLLGSFFVLSTVLALVTALKRLKFRYVILAVFFMTCAICSKELMVFFLPAAVFLLWRISPNIDKQWRKKAIGVFFLPFVAAGSLYFLLRMLRHGSESSLASLLERYSYGAFDTVRVIFKVFGFYLKKMVAPLPLNFAIVSAADFYVWLGLAGLCVMIWLLRKKCLEFDLLIISAFLITPGILIALSNVAWTPLAERYVYLPSVFFVVGMALFLKRVIPSEQFCSLGLAILLIFMIMATVERTLIWQDNALLYADSIKKSPDFAAMNNELAIALIETGDLTSAQKILSEGKKLPSASPLLYINQARIFIQQNDLKSARREMEQVTADKSTANLEALKMLARIDEHRLRKEGYGSIEDDLIDTYITIIQRGADPFYDYRLGQIYLHEEKKEQALYHFESAANRSAPDTHYKEAAQKFTQKLKAELKEKNAH